MDKSQEKINMSLDDIIKLNKKEKQAALKQTRGRGRGRGVTNVNKRGQAGTFSGKGRGRGQVRTGGQIAGGKQSMRGVNRGGPRGRGGISRGRGRGRGIQQTANAAISPLNRKPNVKAARGRGRGNIRTTTSYRNSNLKQTNNDNPISQAQRRERLNMVKTQAALMRKKEMAMKNLQTAKRTMQDINKAIQKTARSNVVDSRRGFISANGAAMQAAGRGSQTGGRGRRKLLTGLMRQNFKGSTMSLASNASGRQMVNTSVTIRNQMNNAKSRRRQWKANNQSDNVTIQVATSSPQNQSFNSNKSFSPKPSIMDQLKLLKPAISTTYKFQKNVFASNTTNVSLNDRFSSASSSSLSENNNLIEGRKVFI